MNAVKNIRLFVPLLIVLAIGVFSPGGAKEVFNQSIVFGDSTQDSGYFRYNSSGSTAMDAAVAQAVSQGASGAFVGPGVVNSIMLASKFGLNGAAIGGGGTNYAVGGSYAAASKAGTIPATEQIQRYLSSVNGSANPDALYVVKCGDNDLTYVTNQGAAWRAANPTYLARQADLLASSVSALQAAGARIILVPNSYNYAVFAGPGGSIPGGKADEYSRSVAFGLERWSSLTRLGVSFIPADIDSLFRFVVKNPALFGFTATSVLSASAPSTVSALLTTWANITPAQMQSYLFVDGVHLTTAGQKIEADYYFNLLTAPSMISMLAEGPVQGSLARTAAIQGQIDLSWQHRGPDGVNLWGNGGAGSLKMNNASGFPDASGTPLTASVGADYKTSFGLIVGAAFTGGYQTQTFSLDGGHFDQTDQTLTLYAAYRIGPVWGDLVGSYGLVQDNLSRDVTLGIFTDSNSGKTDGESMTLALRVGGDIVLGPVTTGPVLGLVLQQVNIDGFTESGTSGVTALSYGSQTRDSAVSQLGWRVLADVGKWRPFAEAKWNHELASTNRDIEAALTSVSTTPYFMPAAPVASDWVTVSLGTSYKINEKVMLRGAASAVFSNPQVTSYGGELGVSVSF